MKEYPWGRGRWPTDPITPESIAWPAYQQLDAAAMVLPRTPENVWLRVEFEREVALRSAVAYGRHLWDLTPRRHLWIISPQGSIRQVY